MGRQGETVVDSFSLSPSLHVSLSLFTSLFAIALSFTTSVQAANLLDQVPRDALAVVVVNNVAQCDAKATKLLAAIGQPLPSLLAMVTSIAGIESGLDASNDLMLVLLPPASNSQQYHVAIWLPTQDYDALVRSMDGDPKRRVAPVTVAGEDLLVVHEGDWAVVSDPDEHDRLDHLRDAPGSPPRRLSEWKTWAARQDLALIVLPSGIKALGALAVHRQPRGRRAQSEPDSTRDDLFGQPEPVNPSLGPLARFEPTLRRLIASAPELVRWLAEADGAACGARVDDAGNLVVDARLACNADALPPPDAASPRPAQQLYRGGAFKVAGDGLLSPRWVVPAVAPAIRLRVVALASTFGATPEPESIERFTREIELAAGDVEAFSVLTRPGRDTEGVATNNFLTLRVKSSSEFVERARQAIDRWNELSQRAEGSVRLEFIARPISVAERTGSEYSIDVAQAIGAPALPDIKPMMEKLFGPGGKFRLQIVALDDRSVLLATATEAQLIEVISSLRDAPPALPEIRAAEALLAERSDWRLFASPHGYTTWLRRQMDVILGPVIGGPVVPDFPESPPLGVAGGVDGNVVWTELALPAETIRGFRAYRQQ